MPVFIDQVVFRGKIESPSNPSGTSDPAAMSQAQRDALIAEVTQAVVDHLERALERAGER